MVKNPDIIKDLAKVDLNVLFKWIIRVAKDVQHIDELGLAPEAIKVLEKFVTGEPVTNAELDKVARDTYSHTNWAVGCVATASQCAINSRLPDTMRNNSNKIIPFVVHREYFADKYQKVNTWREHRVIGLIYAYHWAVAARRGAMFSGPIEKQPDRHPEKYRLEVQKLYISWLNEEIAK